MELIEKIFLLTTDELVEALKEANLDTTGNECILRYRYREHLLSMEESEKELQEIEFSPTWGNEPDYNKEEKQYLYVIWEILERGSFKVDRTKVGTLGVFGRQMRFSLKNDTIPLLTTKTVFWKGVVEEMLWFIKGSTDAKELAKVGVNIWNANATRQFLDSVGLNHYREGDLGPIYGFQWRHCGANYVDCDTIYSGQGVDQLQSVIDAVKNNPESRRILMTAWNPPDLGKVALPPCHCLAQFYVERGRLSCQMYQRSADMGLGVPFNIASYSLLTHLIANVTGLKAGEFVHVLGDAHVYLNHIFALKEQLNRKPKPFPKLLIKRKLENIRDAVWEDFELKGYDPHPKLEMSMAV